VRLHAFGPLCDFLMFFVSVLLGNFPHAFSAYVVLLLFYYGLGLVSRYVFLRTTFWTRRDLMV
jgi:hypothetical protein